MDHSSLIPRPSYLSVLEAYEGSQQVKVLQGVRRCGKSSLLMLFQQQLLDRGVDPGNVFFKRFDLLEEPLDYSAQQLLDEVVLAWKASDRDVLFYVFLDEIQDVPGWEKVVRRLHTEPGIDVYITGSNAHLLSSDLATYLAGRVAKIEVYPLSFKEYLAFRKIGSEGTAVQESAFASYLRYGGMPSLFSLAQGSDDFIIRELSALTDTVLLNDVALRVGIRDIALLERLSTYLFATSGSLFSSRKIQGALRSAGWKTSVETLENYITALEQAYILYQAPQMGLGGKNLLNPLRKFYGVDTGLRNLAIGFAQRDMGFKLENVIFMELKRRGFQVFVGATPQSEVDFVAHRHDERIYIQVCESIPDERVLARETAPFHEVADSFAKYLLTLDRLHCGVTPDGIKIVNAVDWLLGLTG